MDDCIDIYLPVICLCSVCIGGGSESDILCWSVSVANCYSGQESRLEWNQLERPDFEVYLIRWHLKYGNRGDFVAVHHSISGQATGNHCIRSAISLPQRLRRALSYHSRGDSLPHGLFFHARNRHAHQYIAMVTVPCAAL